MLTLFSTPKPFRGHIGVIQRNALQSWKRLHPDAEVILFGDDEGTAEVCRELGLRHEPNVQRSEFGTKRLDSIFGPAQEMARHDMLSYVNCDIVLTKEFVAAAARLKESRAQFLMVGRRWDTDITEPVDFSQSDWEEKIVARAKTEGYRRFYHNIDYFLFTRGLYTQIPALVIGRIWWDHWLVGKAKSSGIPVVDVSALVCAVHQNHDYGYHPKGMEGVWKDQEARRNHELARRDTRLATIEDATYRLTEAGVLPNRGHWMAPAKRKWRAASRTMRGALRSTIWHPLLNLSRPLRHAMGLKKEALPETLRSSERRHWMD